MDEKNYSLEITKEFLDEYVKFEKIKKESPDIFSRFEEKYDDVFNMYRQTRNALVHNRVGVDSSYPLIISKFTLCGLKEKIRWMTTKALDRCIKAHNIQSVGVDTPIYEAIALMNKYNYSYLPIFEQGKIRYIISEKSIISILSDSKEGLLYDKTVKIGDYLSYFKLDGNPNEFYDFIGRDTLLYDLKDVFSNVKNDKKCGALFITQNGKKDECVLGMVTLWDVVNN